MKRPITKAVFRRFPACWSYRFSGRTRREGWVAAAGPDKPGADTMDATGWRGVGDRAPHCLQRGASNWTNPHEGQRIVPPHLRHSVQREIHAGGGLLSLLDSKVVGKREAHPRRHQIRREDLLLDVIPGHEIIVELAGEADPIFGAGPLLLKPKDHL